MDYILEKMIELKADGVDFIPISFAAMNKDYENCEIVSTHTRLEVENGLKYIPKTPYVFWNDVNGKKTYIDQEENDIKIIFLDIDGVLNGYNKWTYFAINVSRKLHIPVSFMRETLDIFGIKEKYVRRLAKIVHSTGAKVVMSSSWRFGYWKRPYDDMCDDQQRLQLKAESPLLQGWDGQPK